MDDGVDRYLGINRRYERSPRSKDLPLRETRWRYFRRTYTNVQLHTRVGALHPNVMECCQECTAMENELSRVGNAVATASLIENWID